MTTVFEVWYDARDGVRRHLKADSEDGVRQIISDIHADEQRVQDLARSVGLKPDEHDLNIAVMKTTTSTQPVELS